MAVGDQQLLWMIINGGGDQQWFEVTIDGEWLWMLNNGGGDIRSWQGPTMIWMLNNYGSDQ